MRSTDPHYRPDIDGLRAIAIIFVVIYHLKPQWIPGGFIGVDVFFVISGYLITSLVVRRIDDNRFSATSFYAARIRRLFPALLLVLTTSLVWAWLRLLPSDFASLGRHTAATLGFFENFLLKRESGYFDEAANFKPLAHAWSLSIEEQFYLIYPWLLIGLRDKKKLRLYMLLMLWFISFFSSIWLVREDSSGGYLLPWSRFWELSSGSLLAFLELRQIQVKPATGLYFSALGLVLIFFSAFMLNSTSPFPGIMALPATAGAILIIHGGKLNQINRRLLSRGYMVYVGLLSYPIYLWHWPLRTYLLFEITEAPSNIELAAVGLLSVLLAHVTYTLIERPIRNGLSARSRKRLLILLICGSAILAGLSSLIKSMNGLPARYPEMPPELAIENPSAPEEWRPKRCFLWPKQLPMELGSECFAGGSKRQTNPEPRVLLWGDSYAAQLYPGLKEKWGKQAEITQITAMACPPISNIQTADSSSCPEVFAFALDHAIKHRYDLVILAAQWDRILTDSRMKDLQGTLQRLRDNGVKNIVIFGPPTRWEKALPKLMLNRFLNYPQSALPDRLESGYSKSTLTIDSELELMAKARGVGYLSLLKLLCNKEGCLARSNGLLTSPDTGHLSITGSHAIFDQLQSIKEVIGNQTGAPQ